MDNIIFTLIKLIEKLNIPITKTSVSESIIEHPYYPSLLSISDFLADYNVSNSSYKIRLEDLKLINTPFIAHTVDENFFVVENKPNGSLIISLEDGYSEISKEEFAQKFSGYILLAFPTKESGDAKYTKTRLVEVFNFLKFPVVISLIFCILTYILYTDTAFFVNINRYVLTLTVIKVIGFSVSIFLLIQSVDINNPFVNKLCLGGVSNCSTILSSKAAKVLGGTVSLSEIGFSYFSSTLLMLFFYSKSASVIQLLALLNCLCLPFTVYSIYYQGVIAKKWCTLCCAIQILLWLEFIGFSHFLFKRIRINLLFSEIIGMTLCFLMPILLWAIIKHFLLLKEKLDITVENLHKFKKSESIFNHSLISNNKFRLIKDDESFIIGKENSKNIVTIITNLYCNACTETHDLLQQWLFKDFGSFKLQTIFLGAEDDILSENTAKYMTALTLRNSKEKSMEILTTWYNLNKKDYQFLINSYPIEYLEKDTDIFLKQKEWCKLIEITHTPTILINGYKLPDFYRPEDIKYFI